MRILILVALLVSISFYAIWRFHQPSAPTASVPMPPVVIPAPTITSPPVIATPLVPASPSVITKSTPAAVSLPTGPAPTVTTSPPASNPLIEPRLLGTWLLCGGRQGQPSSNQVYKLEIKPDATVDFCLKGEYVGDNLKHDPIYADGKINACHVKFLKQDGANTWRLDVLTDRNRLLHLTLIMRNKGEGVHLPYYNERYSYLPDNTCLAVYEGAGEGEPLEYYPTGGGFIFLQSPSKSDPAVK